MVTKRKKSKKKIRWILLSAAVLLLGSTAFTYWWVVEKAHFTAPKFELFIHTGASFNDVLEELGPQLDDVTSFEFLADRMHYAEAVKPGRYVLTGPLSNREILVKLRAGLQDPVTVTLQRARYVEELAGIWASKLEPDSNAFVQVFHDSAYWAGEGFTPRQVLLVFIPNSYQFNWNTTPKQVVERMVQEYRKFWNPERTALADSMGFTPIQVGIMASMLVKETNAVDEMPCMAGVFVNRLHKNMLLQVDPTVIYAWGDFSIRRVLNYHLAIDHPYNTYRYKGLPPGPIAMPSIAAIDAVLHYEHHTYVYYCAKADGSGHHNFATTPAEHQRNARLFHQMLNARKNKP